MSHGISRAGAAQPGAHWRVRASRRQRGLRLSMNSKYPYFLFMYSKYPSFYVQ